MSNNEEQTFINTPIQKLVEDTQKNSTTGPLVGSIIVILVMIVGGLYFFGSLIVEKKAQIQTQQVQEEEIKTQEVEQTAKQSSSDDVGSIEADLQATDIDNLDEGFGEIEKEF